MKIIEGIIFYCLKQLNGERTIYSIYHLLKGKKSSQTIQDAHWYRLTKYFGIYHPITREFLEESIQTSFKRGWLKEVGDQRFTLTGQGENELGAFWKKQKALNHLNGWKYQQTSVFWERLSLLVQVSSNLVNNEANYLPIQKNKEIQQWIKNFLQKSSLPRDIFGKKLYAELVDCLEKADNLNPLVLVLRLTGYNHIGLTSTQAADQLHMEISSYHIEFLTILHYMIRQLSENPKTYPLLSCLVTDSSPNLSLTLSSSRTLSLINQGYSLEEIAKLRRLKVNTIEDHIVEIALNVAQFSIDNYIDKQTQAKIIAAAQREDTRQLKQIRNAVKGANYFEIRLVLAKMGAEQC
ncbi:helix-turn-helix domain-containing protein [Bacillota bacterium Lsc_1132]